MVYRYFLLVLVTFPVVKGFAQSTIGLASVTLTKNDPQFSAVLTAFRTVESTVERTESTEKPFSTHDLLPCILLDKRDQGLDTLWIIDPFSLRLEYPGENGTIGSVTTPLDERHLLIRFPYTPQVRALQFIVPGESRKSAKVKLKTN